MSLSIYEQDTILHTNIPSIKTLSVSSNRGVWECLSRPNSTTYKLRIEYQLPPHFVLRNPTAYFYPRVYVLSPPLQYRYDVELSPLPHVWWDQRYKNEPNLCLFRSQDSEWSYDDPIASTTYLDASEWLYFYEIWLADGRWFGGGEHQLPAKEAEKDGIKTIRRDAFAGASKTALAA